MADEERIALGLDLGPTVESAKAAETALEQTKVATSAFAAALAEVNLEEIKAAEQATAFQLALDRLADQQDVTKKQTYGLAEALDRLAKEDASVTTAFVSHAEVKQQSTAAVVRETAKHEAATDKVAKSHVNLGQATLQSSRALQDFAQGGIGGILNNIEGITAALGAGSGVAGLMTVVGLAAYFAIPHIKDMYKALSGEGENQIPQALELLGRLNKSLTENKDRLADLAKQQTLTNAELREYNDRLSYQVDLEKQIEEAQKKKKEREKFKGLGKEPEEDAKERAAILQEAMGDKARLFPGDLQQAADFQLRRAQAAPLGSPEHAAATKAYMEFANRGLVGPGGAAAREGLVAGAFGGNAADILAMSKLLPGQGFEQGLPGAVGAPDPDLKAAEAFGERAHAAGERRRAAAQRRIDTDKNMEQLGKDFQAQQKLGGPQLKLGRDIGEAGKKAADDRNKELGKLGREDIKNRQELDRIREAIHQTIMTVGQGQDTQAHAQMLVNQLQAEVARIQQSQKRIHQREQQLEGRQTLLQRGR